MANRPRAPRVRRRRTGDRETSDKSSQVHTITNQPLQQSLIIDYPMILSLVFGGCCANVWSFETLLNKSSRVGSAMTFAQMFFISIHSLPSFLTWQSLQDSTKISLLPHLKPRQVPLSHWALQVFVLTTGSLLNNWAFAFNIPLSLQIVFRSSGLAVSMLFGYLFLHKVYSIIQVASVLLVTFGVILATLSRPSSPGQQNDQNYYIGVFMLTVSLLLIGLLGMLQERTYRKYGPCWKEGVFYTHCLSLPIFTLIIPDIKYGFKILATSTDKFANIPTTYVILAMNLFTQMLCVSGVNQLTSKVSSVSTNLVLTMRKALSLCLSVWLFGSPWNSGLAVGAGLVFFGSLIYTIGTATEGRRT